MPGGTHLELEERERLAVLKAEGLSLRASAARLGRAASTVSRELRRNALPRGGYPPPHRPVRCPSGNALMSAVNTSGRERPAAPLGRWRSSSRTGGSEASWTSVTSLYGALRVKRSSSPLRLDRRPGRAASPRWDE